MRGIREGKSETIEGQPRIKENVGCFKKSEFTVPHLSNADSMLFQNHTSMFASDEIKTLRSIGRGKRRDSVFMTNCISYVYKGETSVIANKCSGERKIKNKSPLSPEKKILLENMLSERIASEGVNEQEFFQRNGLNV